MTTTQAWRHWGLADGVAVLDEEFDVPRYFQSAKIHMSVKCPQEVGLTLQLAAVSNWREMPTVPVSYRWYDNILNKGMLYGHTICRNNGDCPDNHGEGRICDS